MSFGTRAFAGLAIPVVSRSKITYISVVLQEVQLASIFLIQKESIHWGNLQQMDQLLVPPWGFPGGIVGLSHCILFVDGAHLRVVVNNGIQSVRPNDTWWSHHGLCSAGTLSLMRTTWRLTARCNAAPLSCPSWWWWAQWWPSPFDSARRCHSSQHLCWTCTCQHNRQKCKNELQRLSHSCWQTHCLPWIHKHTSNHNYTESSKHNLLTAHK